MNPLCLPPFESLATTERGPDGSEGDSEDLDAEFTTTAVTEGNVFVSAQPSRPTSAQGDSLTSLPVETLLFQGLQVCKRAATKLGLEWPTSQSEQGTSKSLYDGRRLATPPPYLFYISRGLEAPEGLGAQSTRGMTTS